MKVFCIEFSDPHWVQTVKLIAQSIPIVPVYWTGSLARQKEVQELFPNVVFHDNLGAVRGVGATGLRLEELPIDAQLLSKMSPFERMALKMMERLDATGSSFNFEDRVRHYQRLVSYWNSVLHQMKPDAVLMPITPHLVFDYILYGLCQVAGIPTLLFDRTAVPGRILPRSTIAGPSPELKSRYLELLASANREPLSPALERYLEGLQGDFSTGMAPNFKLKMERMAIVPKAGKGIKQPNWLHVVRYEMRGVFKHLLSQGLRAPRNYLKVPGKAPEDAFVGFFRFHWYRWAGIAKKNRLLSLYKRLMRNADLNQPFVFVALHYQPERNTVPNGGYFADQRVMIQLIAGCLPSGWHVVVKEHTWQLQPFSRGQLARNENFYRDLAAMPNVTFVSMDTSSFALIDAASAVATVTGSVGWEAINRGKPALIFGDAWYEGCEGVNRISSASECRTALSRAADVLIDPDKIRAFVSALDSVAVKGVLEPRLESLGDISLDGNVPALAESLTTRLKMHSSLTFD
jgi:hypothetical protein